MVMPDLNDSSESFSKKSQLGSDSHFGFDDHHLPSSFQRVFAFFIDTLLFGPVISLFLSGLYQKIKYYAFLSEASPERTEAWLLFVLSYYFLWVLLSSLFIRFYGGTPGALFSKMRLHSLDHHRPSLSVILIRQWLFPFHFLFFGFTLLEIYFHPLKLAFHDKVSETLWMSEYAHSQDEVGVFEKNVLRSWFRTAFLFLFVIAALYLFSKYEAIRTSSYSRQQFLQGHNECKVVQQQMALKELPDLIFLNQSEVLSDLCFKAEADLILFSLSSTSDEKAWAYLGLKLMFEKQNSEGDKTAALVLEKALCETPNSACQLLKYQRKEVTTLEGPLKNSWLYRWFEIKEQQRNQDFAAAFAGYEKLSQQFSYPFESLQRSLVMSWAENVFEDRIHELTLNQGAVLQAGGRQPSSVASASLGNSKKPLNPQMNQNFMRAWLQLKKGPAK